MTYQLVPSSQLYGDREFLTHKLSGETDAADRYLFAERIASYGIINFNQMSAKDPKRIKLSDQGITSPILLRSAYAFNYSATSDEIRFRLFSDNQKLAEMKLDYKTMPYQFPDGAILEPDLELEVEPRYNVLRLLIYWQPVHVLSYLSIN